jgi:hypothetical protein
LDWGGWTENCLLKQANNHEKADRITEALSFAIIMATPQYV